MKQRAHKVDEAASGSGLELVNPVSLWDSRFESQWLQLGGRSVCRSHMRHASLRKTQLCNSDADEHFLAQSALLKRHNQPNYLRHNNVMRVDT